MAIQTAHNCRPASTDADDRVPSGKSFAEILAPMREDFLASGMTDEELGEFVDDVVARVRAERRERCGDEADEPSTAPILVLG